MLEQRDGSQKDIEMPKNCPVCQHSLILPENEAITRCPNSHCQAQRMRLLFHFTSKAGMDIEGLGKKAIEQLFNEEIVQDIPDIYGLKVTDLVFLEGWAEKSASKAIAAIAASRETTLARLFSALGIRYVYSIIVFNTNGKRGDAGHAGVVTDTRIVVWDDFHYPLG